MKKEIAVWKPISIILITMLVLACVAGFYIDEIRNTLLDDMKNNLKQIASSTTVSIHSRIEDRISTLENIAYMLENEATSDKTKLMEALRTASENSDFMRLGIADLEGNCITSDHQSFYIGDRIYFQNALKGKSSFSDTLSDKLAGFDLNVIAVPVVENGMISNVLFGASKTNELGEDLLVEIYDGKGFTAIGDNEGNIVLQSPSKAANKNLHNLSQLKFDNGFTVDQLKELKSGLTQFVSLKGEERYLAYMPLGINNWYVYSVVPVSVVTRRIQNIILIAAFTWIVVALVLSLILAYIFTMRKKNQKKLNEVIFFDDVTSHYNFNQFRVLAEQIFTSKNADSYTMIEFDISNFKLVNELYGYAVGNQLLKITMDICEQDCQANEYCARNSADHFILLWKMHEQDAVRQRYLALIQSIQKKAHRENDYLTLEFHGGIYLLHGNENSFSKCHDRCVYAKSQIRDSKTEAYAFFSERMYENMLRHNRMEASIKKAFDNEEFKVYLQPRITLDDQRVHSAEALVRWDSPEYGMLLPGEIIPLLENRGSLEELDMYMLDHVCQILKKWIEADKAIRISFNVSRTYIFKPGFVQRVLQIIDRYGINHEYIEIEITESVIFDRSDALYSIVKELQDNGLYISMDDFGSGYSSLNMLKDIPINTIKLDQVFFKTDAINAQRAKAIISRILNLTHTLNIHSVAEGIENESDMKFLQRMGCDEIQGYYYSRPLSVSYFESYMDAVNKK